MSKHLEIFTGGAKIPALETLKKEVNEHAVQNNLSIERVDIVNYMSIEVDKEEQQIQVATPVACVIFKQM